MTDPAHATDGTGLEHAYLALLEHGREGKLLADEDGTIRYANAAAAAVFGRPAGAMSEDNVFDLAAPDDVPARTALRERVSSDPHVEHVELVTVRADDGATRDVEMRIGHRSDVPSHRGLIVCVSDVTHLLRAQRFAVDQEARYRDVFDHSLDGMLRTAPDGTIFEMNDAFLAMIGYTREEAAALRLHRNDVLDTTDARLPAALAERRRTGRVRAELNMRHKSGALVPTEVTSNMYRDADGRERTSMIVRDMSERQRTERALQDHLRHLAHAEHAALVMIAHADFEGRWLKVPTALCNLLGYTERELLTTSLLDVTHPDDRLETARNFQRLRDGTATSYAMQKRYLHKHGQLVWVHLSVSVARDAGGRPLHSVAYLRDMTAEKVAGERVVEAYALLLRHVTRLAERVGLASDHTEIYRALLELARTTPPANSLLVSRLEPEVGLRTCVFVAEFVDGRYVEADAGQLPPLPLTDSPQSRAIQERRAIFTDEMLELVGGVYVGDDDRPARSSLAIPLIVLGEVIGVFELQSTTPAAFKEEHHAQLQIAASLAAIAIKNVSLLSRERAARERAEVESARLAAALEQAPTLTASVEGPDHVFVTANEKYAQLFGGRQLVGRRVVDVMPELEAQGVLAILDQVLTTGESFVARELPMDLDTAGNGDLVRHYFDLVYQPLRDGRCVHGVLCQAVDITAQVQARMDAERLNANLQAAYDETIEGWARALDLKDEETAGHSQRVTDLTIELGRQMGISDEELVHIRRGALLHDIGKMGVPDRILLKPGSLDAEEWEIMQRHARYARDFLEPIEHLRPAIDIPYCHHEKWDGSGYPRGLAGTAIPVAARIFAVVDVFDALTSERPYRSAWTRDDALAFIVANKGAHFAPDVVDAFMDLNVPVRVARTAETASAGSASRSDRGA